VSLSAKKKTKAVFCEEGTMGLVIFDLDGTLTPQRSTSTTNFERQICLGVAERCQELLAKGYWLAIASNQGGLSKGLEIQAVETHLNWVCQTLGIAAYRYTWEPARKKPEPAMLLELMAQFNTIPVETWMVGDTRDDEQAALAAGIGFVHVTKFVAQGLN
jgi:HAD superfamily hydrolase (TIGR01662 family)